MHALSTVLTVVFSIGRFAERMMAVLFCWHTQHRSLIGFITITLGSSCRQRRVKVEYATALNKVVAARCLDVLLPDGVFGGTGGEELHI